MIQAIHPRELPAMAENKLYLDYIAGARVAREFFSHDPGDWHAALVGRRGYAYPRSQISQLLADYNDSLGAGSAAQDNIEALADAGTFCVIAGQQAGFMGGPAYTAYKIVTTIRLALHLQERLETRVVPMFWLATEDHDFGEINHTHLLQRDGEVGRVGFGWQGQGLPISQLPVTAEVERACQEYFDNLVPGPYLAQTRKRFSPRADEGFSPWIARIWAQLFAPQGLVIVEPRVIRPPASTFFRSALQKSQEIQLCLDRAREQLRAAGYEPALTSEQGGILYTFDPEGQRVRIEDPAAHLGAATLDPQQYSTDAALRPLFADAMLPTLASVLGPGEIAYQAMLRPIYDLFELPQPVIFPRKSYTVLTTPELERIEDYGTDPVALLTEEADLGEVFERLVPASQLEPFVAARSGIEAALSPLRPHLEEIDPSLTRTWSQTLDNALRGLEKLEERAIKAHMSQRGFSKGELQSLQNVLLPRGRLQERIFPLSHFMNRHGPDFVRALFSAGDLDDFRHHLLVMEEAHA